MLLQIYKYGDWKSMKMGSNLSESKANSNVGTLESIYKLNITITFDQVS